MLQHLKLAAATPVKYEYYGNGTKSHSCKLSNIPEREINERRFRPPPPPGHVLIGCH